MVPVTPIITRLAAERYGASFPDAGGALGSEGNIRRILGAAGYTDIQVHMIQRLASAGATLAPVCLSYWHYSTPNTSSRHEVRHDAPVCLSYWRCTMLNTSSRQDVQMVQH